MVSSEITATVSTKGRFNTTFPLFITSLVSQTLKPCRIIIYDDNDVFEDLRKNEIYQNLFCMLQNAGIVWAVEPGEKKGQVRNHQRALKDVTTPWIWRLDDDNILEPDVLEKLWKTANSKERVGAVGPLILDPKNKFNHPLASNKIEDVFLGLNIQWCNIDRHEHISVDHLQGSTFLFRKEAASHGYDMSLSKVGHREETIFTYQMKRAGWLLLVDTSAKTWHMRYGAGGIRSTDSAKLFSDDEHIFKTYLKIWKVYPTPVKFIPLDGGIGDHYAFRQVLPDIRAKYPNHKIVIGACYPDVFSDEPDVTIISLAEIGSFVKVDDFNIYAWMDKMNWKKSLSEAYKTMYAK